MATNDTSENASKEYKGTIKEDVGYATNDRQLEAEGQADQLASTTEEATKEATKDAKHTGS